MRSAMFLIVWVFLFFNMQGCLDLGATSDLLPVGTPFVIRGTMTLADQNGACLVWHGENGVSYYLYQDALLDNNSFDRITTPGATSRLVVATRSDLTAPCTVDKIVQVQSVLEILE